MARNLFALVLAGGSGERFWPLSRRQRPKQLLSLFSDETLLEAALARLEGLVPPERRIILTNRDQEAAVRRIVGDRLPAENIVAEPAKRDTAPAIALGAGLIARRDPEATMVVLPADHLITDVAGFQASIQAAAAAADSGESLVTIGIPPTWACPSFGYIEKGEEVTIPGAEGVFEVLRFREKPSADLAETFLKRGNFRWNAGMFVWTVPLIRRELAANAPELAAFVDALAGDEAPESILARTFPELQKLSIDYAVMENAKRVLMVEAGFDWDDVGGWIAAAKYWERDEAGNATRSEISTLDAFQNIVYAEGKTRIALVGVSDLIVVQSGDAVLVCKRSDADRIKLLVGELPRELQ